MLLKEMFSPIGAPKQDQQDIDWLGDLKFFIDNETDVLSKSFFPAIEKHKQYQGHPHAYKLYIKPLESVCETYCQKFEIKDKADKFPKEQLIALAKQMAEEQEKHIQSGHYK